MTKPEEVYNYELSKLKERKISISQIDNPTEEMKWIALENGDYGILKFNLTDTMLIRAVEMGYDLSDLKSNRLSSIVISDESIIKGLNSREYFDKNDKFIIFITNTYNITHDIALTLCKKCSYYYNIYENLITDKDEQNQIVKSHLKRDLMYKNTGNFAEYFMTWGLSKSLELKDEDWDYIIDNGLKISSYIYGRNNYISKRAKNIYITSYIDNIDNIVNKTVEDWENYLKKYSQLGESCCKVINKYASTKEFIEAFKQTDGTLIKYIKKPCSKLCKAAIEINPFNIRYIKNPSDKLRILALKLNKGALNSIDKKTKAVCNFLGEEYSEEKVNPYPEKYYLCILDANLADEDNLVRVMVKQGKEMQRFMNESTKLSFGNLIDNSEVFIKDIIKYQPITEEEYTTIKKLGLDNIKSGYWSDID